MRYQYSEQWTLETRELAGKLGFSHIDVEKIAVLKSTGSKARRTIARIHGLGKAMQLAMQTKPFYAIELISERFDRQSPEEQTKTLIHELLHIPACFGGGFRKHRPYVTALTVEDAYQKLKKTELK